MSNMIGRKVGWGIFVPLRHFLGRSVSYGSSDLVRKTSVGLIDGTTELLDIETRNLCRCQTCYGPFSHQKLVPDICIGVKVDEILDVNDNYINLKWSDGHSGLIARTAIGAYGSQPVSGLLKKYYALSVRDNNEMEFWSKDEAAVSDPFDYSVVIKSDESIRKFLAHFMKYGFAILSGLPEELNFEKIQKLHNDSLGIGPMRRSVFDVIDIVEAKESPNNFAYSSEALPLHLDMSYYFESPAVQLFACLKSSVSGGESFWVDSFSVASEVRSERPEFFEILSTVPMFYRHDPPGSNRSLASAGSVIQLSGQNIYRIKDHTGSMDEFSFIQNTDLETRKKWWEAYSYYRTKVDDPSRRVVRKLLNGEIAMTDNWRVFHARNSFRKERGQERVVATWYTDWNHVQNRVIGSGQEAVFLDLE